MIWKLSICVEETGVKAKTANEKTGEIVWAEMKVDV